MKRQLPDHHRTTTPRRGSTFVVVLALLALLSIIGLAFVTFTGAEKESAEYFVATSNREVAPQINTEDTIEFGVRQLILGARNDQVNSALWGGRHSLLAGLFGNDLNPHSGEGIHLAINLNGQAIVDQDFNGNQDANFGLLQPINDSPVVSGGRVPAIIRQFQLPAPDVGYTYPDINNVFLSWQGMALNYETSLPASVILPSFHRPQLLRIANQPIAYWEVVPQSQKNILRPHPLHIHMLSDGNSSGLPRFVRNSSEATALGLSGPFPWGTEDINGNGQLDTEDTNNNDALDSGEDLNGNGFLDTEDLNGNGTLDNQGHHGVWTLSGSPVRPGQWGRTLVNGGPDTFYRLDANGNPVPQQSFAPTYSFDADADGDGVKEAVWLDLDHPVRVLADGRKVIPLFAFTVRDADGLVNVNTAGNSVNFGADGRIGQLASASQFNLNEDTNRNGVLDTGEDVNITNELLDISFISRSNLGMTPAEVNPQWVLNAHPQLDKPSHRTPQDLFQQHAYPANQFNSAPVNRVHASNMEWWFALNGAFDSNSGVYYHGREGNLTQPNNQSWGAGVFNIDDNLNQSEGMAALGQLRSFTHPLDFRGTGRFIVNARDPNDPSDQSRKWRVNMFTNNLNRYSTYEGYQGSVRWDAISSTSSTKRNANWYQDDSTETILDHRYRQNSDTIFSADENYFLQASNSDIELSPAESRLAHLMPYNLRDNVRAEQIRRNLTTDSWDLKTPSIRKSQCRPGEFPGGRFPTSLQNVLRPEVYQLLRQTAELSVAPVRFQQHYKNYDPVTDYYTRQYRLSVNHLLESDGNGVDLVMRPLTPYPDASTPNLEVVELRTRAHRDRQRLARDIYTLLYLYGGGRDDLFNSAGVLQTNALVMTNGVVTTSRQYHTITRLREMAQFAVNLVDSLDRDDVITKFEYDKDLYDGWGLDDYAFTVEGGIPNFLATNHPEYTREYPTDSQTRGVVFGAERQKLTLSEFHAVRTMQVRKSDGTFVDHTATAYDDQQPHVFAYAEVENASVFPVALGRGHWRIVFQENDGKAGVTDDSGKARILTFWGTNAFWGPVATGSKRAIAVRGDRADETTPYPLTTPTHLFGSALAIDRSNHDYMMQPTTPYPVIVPPVLNWTIYNNLKLNYTLFDLITPQNPNAPRFRVTDPSWTDYKDEEERLLELPDCFTNPVHPGNSNIDICLVLQRRMDLTRNDVPDPYLTGPMAQATYDRGQNPWIEVDRIEYTRAAANWEFKIEPEQMANMQPDPNILAELLELTSRERPEPLKRGFETNHAQQERANSVVAVNSTQQPRRVVHRQLDRDFASVGELLTLPLYGPQEITRSLQFAGKRPKDQYATSISMLTPKPAIRSFIAANRFLRPDHPSRQFPLTSTTLYPPTSLSDGSVTDGPITKWDNRWSRLLEFVEVPSRNEQFANQNAAAQNYLPANRRHRVAGKINLNTIRDPDVLAALLDEQHAVQRNRSSLPGHFLVDQFARHRDPTRDWWRQFMLSRDNLDNATGFFLPGVPGSRPFRSPGFIAAGSTSIQHTILRSLPHYGPLSGDTDGDGLLNPNGSETQTDPSGQVLFFLGGTDRKRLFELGVGEDLNGNGQEEPDENLDPNGFFNSDIDPVARHHLLSKIMTNSTVRSHVFHVFLKVEWFEAYQGPSPTNSSQTVTLIGAKATDVPSRRAFFVIDRSRAIEQATSIDVLPLLFEDPNNNGVLDPGEDLNGNGTMDPRGFNFADAPRPFNIAPLILHQRIIE